MLKFNVILSGFSSTADGSASLRFTTQELDPTDFLDLADHRKTYGTLVFFKEDEELVTGKNLEHSDQDVSD